MRTVVYRLIVLAMAWLVVLRKVYREVSSPYLTAQEVQRLGSAKAAEVIPDLPEPLAEAVLAWNPYLVRKDGKWQVK